MSKGKKILTSIVWCLPFAVSGFSAPFIFKAAPTPLVGGHYAGVLFLFAGLWALFVSFKHHFNGWLKTYFVLFFGLELFFWSSRFTNDTPLAKSSLVGISGSHWHMALTLLYLAALLLLFFGEYLKVKEFPDRNNESF